jgi:hypothetical protein
MRKCSFLSTRWRRFKAGWLAGLRYLVASFSWLGPNPNSSAQFSCRKKEKEKPIKPTLINSTDYLVTGRFIRKEIKVLN